MIAKNNIFNIRQGAKWKGMTGVRKGFVEFENQEYAIRAWLILMRTYRRRYGCKTIRQIVTRFAPPNENNTEQYIDYCCEQLRMTADMELEFEIFYVALASAMARMETAVRLRMNDVEKVTKKYNIHICKNGTGKD